jgi:hypothetical protein
MEDYTMSNMLNPTIKFKSNEDKQFTMVSVESLIMNYDTPEADLTYSSQYIEKRDDGTEVPLTSEFDVLLRIIDSGDYRNSKLLWSTIPDGERPAVKLSMTDIIDRGDPKSPIRPTSWTMITSMKKFLSFEEDAYYIQAKIEANIEGCALITVYIYKTIEEVVQ